MSLHNNGACVMLKPKVQEVACQERTRKSPVNPEIQAFLTAFWEDSVEEVQHSHGLKHETHT